MNRSRTAGSAISHRMDPTILRLFGRNSGCVRQPPWALALVSDQGDALDDVPLAGALGLVGGSLLVLWAIAFVAVVEFVRHRDAEFVRHRDAESDEVSVDETAARSA